MNSPTATATWGSPGPPPSVRRRRWTGSRTGRARRRAIGLVLLAGAQVQQREIEQACHTGTQAVELLSGLRSDRGAEYLEDFQLRLEPYRDEPVVREFGARTGAAGRGGVRAQP